MNITAKTKICMTIGDPIEKSLSPKMHNAGLQAAKIDDKYVYVGCHVKISDLADFIKGVRTMKIRFVSCTMPHKIEIMKYLNEIDDIAQKIGAVNSILNDNGILKGFNTDWLGAVRSIEQIASLNGKSVALIGAGGAARAVAFGVIKKHARLKIYNRTLDKAKELAKKFGGEAYSLKNLEEIKNADIIINTTSVGMSPNDNETPLPKEFITNKHIVLDAVYIPYETRFLKEAKEQGAKIIYGIEMLVQQGAAQFEVYTGCIAPEDAMRKTLL